MTHAGGVGRPIDVVKVDAKILDIDHVAHVRIIQSPQRPIDDIKMHRSCQKTLEAFDLLWKDSRIKGAIGRPSLVFFSRICIHKN